MNEIVAKGEKVLVGVAPPRPPPPPPSQPASGPTSAVSMDPAVMKMAGDGQSVVAPPAPPPYQGPEYTLMYLRGKSATSKGGEAATNKALKQVQDVLQVRADV